MSVRFSKVAHATLAGVFEHIRYMTNGTYPLRPSPSPGEESLGQGGDEGDLDEQADDSLTCCQTSVGVSEADVRGEEPTSVKAVDAQDQGFVPRQVWGRELRVEQVEAHEGEGEKVRAMTPLTQRRALVRAPIAGRVRGM